ncbi:MAG: hypothetical protein RL489_2255 [Pseudomonadota bacterium]|jgi:hypothetical protein
MRTEVTPHTIQEIAADYESAVSWLASVGFTIERGRLAEYRKVVSTLASDFPNQGWGDMSDPKRQKMVCTALLEVRELISIHRGLSGVDDKAATRDIKLYLKGPFSPESELSSSSSNRPRNIGFELYLNALFSCAGLRPVYGTTADLSFTLQDQTFFVEAKRPTSAKAAESLIDDANKQLSRRLKDFPGHKAKGIIALDLTKVINPENKVMPVFGEDHLHGLMYNEDRRQIGALSCFWNRKRHKRVVGVLLHYKLLTNFISPGSLNTLKWIGTVKLVDDPLLDEIGTALERVVRVIC